MWKWITPSLITAIALSMCTGVCQFHFFVPQINIFRFYWVKTYNCCKLYKYSFWHFHVLLLQKSNLWNLHKMFHLQDAKILFSRWTQIVVNWDIKSYLLLVIVLLNKVGCKDNFSTSFILFIMNFCFNKVSQELLRVYLHYRFMYYWCWDNPLNIHTCASIKLMQIIFHSQCIVYISSALKFQLYQLMVQSDNRVRW